MSDTSIVGDTSLLLYLGRIRKVELLTSLYRRVYVPKQVVSELDTGRLLRGDTIDPRNMDRFAIVSVSQEEIDTLPPKHLGIGEKSVIAYTLKHKKYVAGIDDRIARLFAENLGIKVVGIIGVFLKAKDISLIRHVKPLLKEIQSQGFRMAEDLYEEVLRLAGESEA